MPSEVDNLMSYNIHPSATGLNKIQWDIIHDPGVIWGFAVGDEDQEQISPSYDNAKVVQVIDKIKENNYNAAFSEITFPTGLNLIGQDIVLGGHTYEYIIIDAPLTNYEEKKEITTNLYQRIDGISREVDGEEKSMEKFDFDVKDYLYDGIKSVPFDIFVLEEDADALETYISQTTFQIENVNAGINDAIDDGEGFNPSGYACNICIRASMHHIANDNVLFPYYISPN